VTADPNKLQRDLTRSSSNRWLKNEKMPERCVAARCDNIGDPAKGVSMHRITKDARCFDQKEYSDGEIENLT